MTIFAEYYFSRLLSFTQSVRIYSADGTRITLTSETGGVGGKMGLYLIEEKQTADYIKKDGY